MSECYSHHIKLGLQRGAKLGLAASQSKTTWKNVRRGVFLGCPARSIERYGGRGGGAHKNKCMQPTLRLHEGVEKSAGKL